MDVSVIISTYNPRPEYLTRVLQSLKNQSLPRTKWELIVVDNASTPAIHPDLSWHSHGHLLQEPKPGLTSARKRGVRESCGAICILVDDDNVLYPDYLENVVTHFQRLPDVGALGGKSLADFEAVPPEWIGQFLNLLACRDLGSAELVCSLSKNPETQLNEYPECAPIGAGMAFRRQAAAIWLEDDHVFSDRTGRELSSGGDNDIVLNILEQGWKVGYSPGIILTHLIPAFRLEPAYLARLNHGIAKSWVQVLQKHHANPWKPLPAWTLPSRKIRAWVRYRAWAGPVEHIRWKGACGHFEGLALIHSS